MPIRGKVAGYTHLLVNIGWRKQHFRDGGIVTVSRSDDLALRITGLRPGETPFLQPLGTDPESASVPDEDLQPITQAVAEQEQVPSQGLTRQSIPDLTVQPLESLAHVGDPDCQDRSVWLAPIQTRLIPAPVHSP